MENTDQILELLQKKSLSDSEKQTLKNFTDSDEEIKSFINIYTNLKSSLSDSKHIQTDLLSSFILYEAGEDPGNKLAPIVRDKITAHLNECSTCKEEYDLLLGEYNEVSQHVNKNIRGEHNSEVDSVKRITFIPEFLRQTNLRFMYVTLTVLLVGYLGLFSFSSLTIPYYEKNIFSESDDNSYLTRGRTSVLFQQGLNSIEQGDYDAAIKYLNEDILENKNDRSIFYSYYITGITYLKAAESDFVGLFKSFNKQDVELAISNLKESIEKNDSGDYENLKLDSYYYMGRSYLLIKEKDLALVSFQKVIDGKGKFARESNDLIVQMEKN